MPDSSSALLDFGPVSGPSFGPLSFGDFFAQGFSSTAWKAGFGREKGFRRFARGRLKRALLDFGASRDLFGLADFVGSRRGRI
mmetsp:Transcript_13116/g.46470  ORF Transcript_13116/g.46470 Transcript_13116/m.46470 type:complete len:83 (+) Transcript_13116:425-673(+)